MLTQKLRRLRLARAAEAVEAHHQQALKDKLGYLEFLEHLVDDELNSRDNKGLQKRLRSARFPVVKTLEDFDFAFQPKLDAKLIKSLATCEFVTQHENVLFIGPPGVGKSHLGTSLAVKACMRGYSVLFTTIQHLASRVSASMADLSLERLIAQYVEADLVVLDELGFTPLNKVVADHIFRVVAERYERGSIIITSNKPFEQWGEMFADPILATAVLDRLVHHAHVVPIIGDSYRTREQRAKVDAATEPVEPVKTRSKSAATTRPQPAG